MSLPRFGGQVSRFSHVIRPGIAVGAVGNAFCAFSKDLVGAFSASTGPAVSMRAISFSSPHTSRVDPMAAFIKAAEAHRSEMHVPHAVVVLECERHPSARLGIGTINQRCPDLRSART